MYTAVQPAAVRTGGCMRTGERKPQRQHGFTYLAILFLVALTAAGLASLGQAWRTAAQREKERELEFRGQAIANAIASYQRSGRTGVVELPRSLDDLLEDRRGDVVRHHLRQRYRDPFTGEADWELVTSEADPTRFYAVHSRSSHPLVKKLAPDGRQLHKANDRLFVAPAATEQILEINQINVLTIHSNTIPTQIYSADRPTIGMHHLQLRGELASTR